MARNFQPHSILQDEQIIIREQPKQGPFRNGVFQDIPASEVPADGLAFAMGYIPRVIGCEAASGCKLFSNISLPPLPGRTGYTIEKSGNVITKTAGENFSINDIGNSIVHDDGIHERIVDYKSITQVIVENSDTHFSSSDAWIHGKVHLTEKHIGTGKVLLHIDTRLFFTDSLLQENYVEIPPVDSRILSDSQSYMIEERDNAILTCPNGIFKVDLGLNENWSYYQINSRPPTTLLTDVAKTIAKIYGHKFTYSVARLSGNSDIRDRKTTDTIIEHETGTCLINENGIDYATIYHERPSGSGISYYTILTGHELLDPSHELSYWTPISNGQFRISINGTSHNVVVNFIGCKTFTEIASKIQSAIRVFDSKVTCQFVDNHFVFTNEVAGGTLTNITAGDAGTDIGSSALFCEYPIGTLTYPSYNNIITIGNLTILLDPITGKELRHITHYPVYSTLDIGINGINPVSGKGNNEEQFVWAYDVPVAKAFVAGNLDDSPVCEAEEGTFQPMDIGCKLRWENGTESTIISYINSKKVAMSGYPNPRVDGMSCAIGGDYSLGKQIRVLTASQTGTTVTRTSGSIFTIDDIGKTIFWAGGKRSLIVAFIDVNTVTVLENQTITSTGACMEPKTRKFTYSLTDEELAARITNFSLSHRYWENLPDCDFAILSAGFFFAQILEKQILYYGQVLANREHFIGSYNPDQYLTFKDKIKLTSEHQDIIVIYCSHSTAGIAINTYLTINVNSVLQYYKVSSQFMIDYIIGLKNKIWFKKLPDGRDFLITSEPAVRIFDGTKFSDNLAQDRYMKVIEAMQDEGIIAYDQFNGLTIFGRDDAYIPEISPS